LTDLEAKSVEVKICFIFGRPLLAGLGAGTCPNKQKEIINDKQFPLINMAVPWGAGLGLGTCATEQQEFLNDEHFTSINLAAP
jgi:hypothetical protein